MIEVHGHKIYAPFIFVCDGKVYSSHSGTRWSVNFTRYGTKAWGNTTWAEQDVTRVCPDGRNSEVNAAFRKVIKGHFRLKDNQIASFLKQQAEEKKQILVEGKSVKRHISGSNGAGSSQPTPAAAPIPDTALGMLIKALIKRGCPESRVMEYIEWEKQQQLTGKLTGVKLNVRLKMFLGTWEEPAPVVEPQPEPTPEPKRSLVEEREHREDVPFYGRRRRDQASFRSDVALNCGDRCVYTGASAIRCEAAHLVAHARKGGASFKNGLLLRADLHTLFDAGLCAIDPATLQIWFAAELLETDADLQRINGAKMRPTMMPINAENLAARWTEFGAIQEITN
ncbi:TPA: HNH endonuclease [Enterobacter roggenkampii]